MAAFYSWIDVLRSVKADGPNPQCFYLIRVGEERTRFMDQQECIQFCVQKIKETR